MNITEFFEKFELFAAAPNAVAKMRALVLELAIQGKLIEQDSNDVSAIASLRKCTKAVRELKINDDDTVPAGWASVPLGCVIASNTGGGTPSKQNPAYWNGSMPWASVKDIQTDKYLTATIDSITEEGLKNSSSNLIPANRLIVVTRMGLGKLAINKIPTAINQDLRAIEPNEALDLDFAYLLFKALKMVGKGVTVKGITIDVLHSMPVALPPFSEQRRIVAKVDDLMALCDCLEAQQQERDNRHAALARASLARFAEAPTPANLDFLFHQAYTITPADLRKSILALAVQGKLVPQDSNDEPAATMIQRVAEGVRPARFDKRSTAKIQGIAALSVGPTERNVPHGWVCAPLIQIARLESGHTPSRSRPDWWGGDVSWVGVVDARLHDGKTIYETRQHTNEEGLANSAARLLPVGTVCVSRTASVGYVIILGKSMATSQDFVNWVPSEAVTSDWLRLVFTSEKDAFNRFSKGAVHQTIYYPEWLSMHTLLPPLAEQRRIVAKVDQLMALVDQLESQLAEAKDRSAALLEAVVHELLNPSAEVIDLASYRAAIGCYTIGKMSHQPYFGRTAAMKMLYLAEAHVGLYLGFQPEREAAGPFDRWIYRFEEEGQQKEWFRAVKNTSNGKMKVEYQPGKMLAAQAAQAEIQLAQEQRKEFDRLLDLVSDKKTEEVEIIATLFAAWNDFLLDGHAPGDDEIVTEVRENWHVKKERFTPALLRQWLGWLRQNNLVPQGRLPHTVHQSKLSLS